MAPCPFRNHGYCDHGDDDCYVCFMFLVHSAITEMTSLIVITEMTSLIVITEMTSRIVINWAAWEL